MKTERITVLGSPEFKSFLTEEAANEKISVSELVRIRCIRKPSDDEILLATLAAELRVAVNAAKTSLADGIAEVNQALKESTMDAK